MKLEEGSIITLGVSNQDFIVVKHVICNNTDYYYLMTTQKPAQMCIVKSVVTQDGQEVVQTVTNKEELGQVIKSSN